LRQIDQRVVAEAPPDLIEIHLFLLMPRAEKWVGTRPREHAIDHEPANRDARLAQLVERAGGLLDWQPLWDEHEDERRRARAQQPAAELTQPLQAIRKRRHDRVVGIVLV